MKWYVFTDREGEISSFAKGTEALDYVEAIVKNGVHHSEFTIICGEEFMYVPPTETGSLRRVEK